MRRLSRETVRTRIAIFLTVMKPYQKRGTGVDTEAIREWLADEITARIMGKPDNEAVVLVPSVVVHADSHSPSQGRWGADEPHPFPDMPFADH